MKLKQYIKEKMLSFYKALTPSQWIRCIVFTAILITIPVVACYYSLVLLLEPKIGFYTFAYSFSALFVPLGCIGLGLIISEEN